MQGRQHLPYGGMVAKRKFSILQHLPYDKRVYHLYHSPPGGMAYSAIHSPDGGMAYSM